MTSSTGSNGFDAVHSAPLAACKRPFLGTSSLLLLMNERLILGNGKPSRAEFRHWSESVALAHGYQVRFEGIGTEDAEHGAPTQMGIFTR